MIKVFIVDDSLVIRKFIKDVLESDNRFKVVGEAPNPYFAMDLLKNVRPDVITLDIEMPRMSGLDFLEKIMSEDPIPTVMISSLTKKGAKETLKALSLGAFDYIEKPQFDRNKGYSDYRAKFLETIYEASKYKPKKIVASRIIGDKDVGNERYSSKDFTKVSVNRPSRKIYAIGSSTGGTEALISIFRELPNNLPGIVITQHMPKNFTGPFAMRLNSNSNVVVKEAVDGEVILDGYAYIAPGDKHLEVVKRSGRYCCKVFEGEPVNRHMPSVEVMFFSVAKNVGNKAMGIMLTGMGKDGANSMLKMKESGSYNISQSKETCVVYGMPRAAEEVGAVEKTISLDKIANEMISYK